MKTIKSIFIVFFLFLPANIFASTASDVFDKASKSTVVILAYDHKNEVTGLGSGVVLLDGSIATNCHVIEDAGRIFERSTANGQHYYSLSCSFGSTSGTLARMVSNSRRSPLAARSFR